MSSQILLSGGDKWYSYSGVLFGDVSVPASINMVLIPNTGLRDSFIQVTPFYGIENNTATGSQLGIEIKINDVTVVKNQNEYQTRINNGESFTLFVPRQSKLEVNSLNAANNNVQERGCTIIGYYL